MVRITILVALLVLAIIEYKKPLPKAVFPIIFLALTLFLALRGGQGTDYFSYEYLYNEFNAAWNEKLCEYGYLLMTRVFSLAGMPFPVFLFFYSCLLMGIAYLIITKTCRNKFMGLFVLYSMYFLQFFENGIRQALAMMIVLGGLVLSIRKSKIWFIIGAIAIACFIHMSSLISIPMIIPYLLAKYDKPQAFIAKHRKLIIVFFTVICCGLLLIYFTGILEKIILILPTTMQVKVSNYLDRGFSVMPLFSRLAFLFFIVFLYIGSRDKNTRLEKTLFYVYLTGFMIYCALFSLNLVASRLNAYYKVVEVILIPNCLATFDFATFKKPNWLRLIRRPIKYALAASLSALLCFMFVKTSKDVMNQSAYYKESYIYPYYTVFNVKDMYELRSAPKYVNKEYYEAMEKPNPRYIGYGDYYSNTYFSSPISASEFDEFDCYDEDSSYGTRDPLSDSGTLPRILS